MWAPFWTNLSNKSIQRTRWTNLPNESSERFRTFRNATTASSQQPTCPLLQRRPSGCLLKCSLKCLLKCLLKLPNYWANFLIMIIILWDTFFGLQRLTLRPKRENLSPKMFHSEQSVCENCLPFKLFWIQNANRRCNYKSNHVAHAQPTLYVELVHHTYRAPHIPISSGRTASEAQDPKSRHTHCSYEQHTLIIHW